MFLFRIVDAQAEEDLRRLRLGQPVRPLQAGGAQDGGGDAQGGALQGGRHIRRVSETINSYFFQMPKSAAYLRNAKERA